METTYEVRIVGILDVEFARVLKDRLAATGMPESMRIEIVEVTAGKVDDNEG